MNNIVINIYSINCGKTDGNLSNTNIVNHIKKFINLRPYIFLFQELSDKQNDDLMEYGTIDRYFSNVCGIKSPTTNYNYNSILLSDDFIIIKDKIKENSQPGNSSRSTGFIPIQHIKSKIVIWVCCLHIRFFGNSDEKYMKRYQQTEFYFNEFDKLMSKNMNIVMGGDFNQKFDDFLIKRLYKKNINLNILKKYIKLLPKNHEKLKTVKFPDGKLTRIDYIFVFGQNLQNQIEIDMFNEENKLPEWDHYPILSKIDLVKSINGGRTNNKLFYIKFILN
jgi:exonuclease III